MPKKLALAGDSICQAVALGLENQGWGFFMQKYFDINKCVVDNRALSGRSTATYLGTDWNALKASLPDFVLINFGTNDQSQAVSIPTYEANLTTFVNEARAQACIPILMTSSPWLAESPAGQINNGTTLVPYVNAVRNVANILGAGLIDFYELLRLKYNSATFNVAYQTWCYTPQIVHPNPAGAELMAHYIMHAMQGACPQLHKLRLKNKPARR